MVRDYLDLCRDPSKDLQRWFAEDKKKPFFRATQSRHDRHSNAATFQLPTRAKPATQFFRHALHELSSRVGAQNGSGQNLAHVPDRQRARVAGLERLQHVQAERESLARPGSAQGDGGAEEARELGRAFGELSRLVSKQLAAAARTGSKQEFAAAKRAILEERDRAARHLVEEFRNARHAMHKRQEARRPGQAPARGPEAAPAAA
jgi:hypothetical protein